MISLGALATIAERGAREVATARCEMCSTPIGETHRHVVELGQPGVRCACQACAILFTQALIGARYRTVPDRILVDRGFVLTPAQLAELGIPVSLAFCYLDSVRSTAVVCYPGPAGVTEGALDEDVWRAIRAATPLAHALESDIEALIVRGGRGVTQLLCYLVPISTAYELVGRLRTHWEGFSGGDVAERELARFFDGLEETV